MKTHCIAFVSELEESRKFLRCGEPVFQCSVCHGPGCIYRDQYFCAYLWVRSRNKV